MELFTLTLPNASREEVLSLSKLLQQELGDLHKEQTVIQLDVTFGEQMSSIACSGVLPDFQLARYGAEVWNRSARALAEFILSAKEDQLLRALIQKDTSYEPEECVKIEDYCLLLLSGSDDTVAGGKEARRRRKKKVMRAIRSYLEEHSYLHLDGFIRFRLQPYMAELQEVVDYAVDEFVLERQYQEFIALLKYFVYIQETKVPLAHLMHSGGHDFTLLNEELQPFESKHVMDGMIVEMVDCDMEMEDMVVSTLIHVSPQNIVIHTQEPDSQVIKTIQQIFEARVHVCVRCNACQAMLWQKQETAPDF